MPLRHLDVTLPVSYDADVATVKRVINDFIKKDKRIVPLPAPFFRLTEYGASSLNFTLRVWTDPGVFWDVKFDLLEGILEVLRKNKIDIPYDQLDVHMIDPKTVLSDSDGKEA